ncbi:(2Fe-2S)-binding protein [Chitinivorax sp. PXF-14]|uniref:(2Fe-2S)-binding protein n=1 Tax=Chitinivorax sp. PXF-14 TaxID=3230488 RepID=UPI00346530DF
MKLCIDRCACRRVSFQSLLALVGDCAGDVDCVMLLTGAGLQCGRCRPWLARALREHLPTLEVELDGRADAAELLQHFQPDEPERG